MTYKDISKRIENIDKQIEYVREWQKTTEVEEGKRMWGDIINNLLAYKNYLIFDKEWQEM